MEMKTAAAPAKGTAAKSGKPWGRFFLPGPTEVLPEVLEAQLRPMIGHRGAGIKTLMEKLQVGLQDVFRTKRQVFLSTSSATGLMEAGARNGVKKKALGLVKSSVSELVARLEHHRVLAVARESARGGRELRLSPDAEIAFGLAPHTAGDPSSR